MGMPLSPYRLRVYGSPDPKHAREYEAPTLLSAFLVWHASVFVLLAHWGVDVCACACVCLCICLSVLCLCLRVHGS